MFQKSFRQYLKLYIHIVISSIFERKFQKRSLSTGVPISCSNISIPANRYALYRQQSATAHNSDKVFLPQIPGSTGNLLATIAMQPNVLANPSESNSKTPIPQLSMPSYPVDKRNIFRSRSFGNTKTHRHSTDLDLLRQYQLQKLQRSNNNIYLSQQCVFVNPESQSSFHTTADGSIVNVAQMEPSYSTVCFVNQPLPQPAPSSMLLPQACCSIDNVMTMSMPDDRMFTIGEQSPPALSDAFDCFGERMPYVPTPMQMPIIEQCYSQHPYTANGKSTSRHSLNIPSGTLDALNAIKSSIPISGRTLIQSRQSSNVDLAKDYNELYRLFEPAAPSSDSCDSSPIVKSRSTQMCGYCSDTGNEPSFVRQPLRKTKSKSQTLITEDQIIDLEYDSDTGWTTKLVRKMEAHKPTPLHLKLQKPIVNSDSETAKRATGSREKPVQEARKRVTRKHSRSPRAHKGSLRAVTAPTKLENRSETKLNPIDNEESLTNIIDDVRAVLLQQPLPKQFPSDVNLNRQNDSPKTQCDSRKANANEFKSKVANNQPDNVVTGAFVKCPSRSHSLASNQDSQSGSDDVFEAPIPSNGAKRFTKRRSSSLDDIRAMAKFTANVASADKINSRSSVVINDKPEYILYEKSPAEFSSSFSVRSAPSSVANYDALQFSNAPGVAQLKTKPKRASLKKTSTTTKQHLPTNKTKRDNNAAKRTNATKRPATGSSEYDVRERGRGRNGNGRESYREPSYREGSQDRNLSDREQRDPRRGSFNRSMSNAEGTSDDKIGKFCVCVCVCFVLVVK